MERLPQTAQQLVLFCPRGKRGDFSLTFTVPQITEIPWCVYLEAQLEQGTTRMSDLTQKFVLTQSWSPEVQSQHHWAEIKVSRGPCSLQRLQGRALPASSNSLETPAGGSGLWPSPVFALFST